MAARQACKGIQHPFLSIQLPRPAHAPHDSALLLNSQIVRRIFFSPFIRMSWSTNSHKIAAAFGGLGFKITSSMTEIIELQSMQNLRYFVSDKSLLRPELPHRDDLYRGWMEGTLVKLDPEHPFICGMHGCHSMDALMDYQKTGASYALKLVPGTPLFRYEPGQEDPRLKLAAPAHAIVDLPLAAAVALAGAPVIAIEGEAPRRRYLLPDQTVYGLEGLLHLGLSVGDMLARQEPGVHLRLKLGLTHPHHCVVQGYNVTRTYARLLADVGKLKRRLLIKDPFSSRRALVPETPSKALEDEVRAHFRSPG